MFALGIAMIVVGTVALLGLFLYQLVMLTIECDRLESALLELAESLGSDDV